MDELRKIIADAIGEHMSGADCANGEHEEAADKVLAVVAAHGVIRDARRYRYLRARDLDTIHKGGVFVGLVPQNLVVNEDDLDRAVDAAIGHPAPPLNTLAA